MLDSLIKWAGTIDWNLYAEKAIEYAYVLYYLPFPLIAVGAYFLLKSVSIPSFWLRTVLGILVAVVFAYFHKQHVSVPQGEMDFSLIGFVALEYLIGASISLLAIFISAIRAIYSGIKNKLKSTKQVNIA